MVVRIHAGHVSHLSFLTILRSRMAAAGGPQLRVPLGFLLVGCPELVSRSRELGCDRLDVRDEAVERGPQAEILPDRLLLPVCPHVLEEAVWVVLAGRLRLLAEVRLHVLVRDLDPGALGERLERELARDRDGSL